MPASHEFAGIVKVPVGPDSLCACVAFWGCFGDLQNWTFYLLANVL